MRCWEVRACSLWFYLPFLLLVVTVSALLSRLNLLLLTRIVLVKRAGEFNCLPLGRPAISWDVDAQPL